MHDKLVEKVNKIDSSGFVLKTKFDADKSELEKQIPDIVDLAENNKNYWNRR